MINVLIIDDDPKICLFFCKLLKQMGHHSESAYTVKKGRSLFNSQLFDLILLDLELPDGNGVELLPEFINSHSNPEVIIITGTGDARGAEFAFKYGAWDYVQKPFLLSEVSLPITRALQYRKEKQTTKTKVPLFRSNIVGESNAIHKCLEEVARASMTDASVLITGETGTGKELFARAIHENSKRASNPFIIVDCGALPETLVESTLFGHEKGSFTGAQKKQVGLIAQADSGTLMLDEVGDLPLNVQKNFLRALQERCVRPIGGESEKPVDFRLVGATNLDLDQMVKEKLFREDLLFRIRAIEIKLPPLREREKDTEDIIIKKVHELAQRYGIETKAVSQEFFQTLATYHWPGNVRELINVLEYVLASAGMDPTLLPKHLPPEYRILNLQFDPVSEDAPNAFTSRDFDREDDLPTLNDCRHRIETDYLKELMSRSKDWKTACRISGISRSRLYGLLKKHHIHGFSN